MGVSTHYSRYQPAASWPFTCVGVERSNLTPVISRVNDPWPIGVTLHIQLVTRASGRQQIVTHFIIQMFAKTNKAQLGSSLFRKHMCEGQECFVLWDMTPCLAFFVRPTDVASTGRRSTSLCVTSVTRVCVCCVWCRYTRDTPSPTMSRPSPSTETSWPSASRSQRRVSPPSNRKYNKSRNTSRSATSNLTVCWSPYKTEVGYTTNHITRADLLPQIWRSVDHHTKQR